MHGTAALLKREIEAKLANRIPAALSPIAQQAPRLHPLGDARLDALLGGGLPFGSVCELTGPGGSGRSSIALSLLARASNEGACAYIDVNDTLSPHSAAAAGVELANLLWMRFAGIMQSHTPDVKHPERSKRSQIESGGHRPIHGGCGSSHPRGETKGLAPALEQMLFDKEERRRRKMEGTPGHPNQPLGLHTASQDQVEWERFNLRTVDRTDPLRCSDKEAAEAARLRAASGHPRVSTNYSPAEAPGPASTGLCGRRTRFCCQVAFVIVVLDLASRRHRQEALRIPSATWFRYRRAAQEGNAILLLLTREPCARSSAACVLECFVGEPPIVRGVLTLSPHVAEIARQRIRTGSWQEGAGASRELGCGTGMDARGGEIACPLPGSTYRSSPSQLGSAALLSCVFSRAWSWRAFRRRRRSSRYARGPEPPALSTVCARCRPRPVAQELFAPDRSKKRGQPSCLP